jgi:hypothetical protein
VSRPRKLAIHFCPAIHSILHPLPSLEHQLHFQPSTLSTPSQLYLVDAHTMSSLLSKQSLTALGFVATLVGLANVGAHTLLPKRASVKERRIYTWLAFDSLCHAVIEGTFLYLSIGGRTVNASTSFMAYLWQDYARADARWGFADPTVVSLEICKMSSIQMSLRSISCTDVVSFIFLPLVTVLGCGPLAAYCCYLLGKNDPAYHFWVVVLSVSELYGGE